MMKKIQHFLRVILKKVNITLSDRQWDSCLQFIKFSIVGLSNFLVNYITYAFVLFLQGSYHAANITAFITSVFNAFYWNNKYVFKADSQKRSLLKTLVKTYISYAFSGLLLTELLLYIEVSILGLPAIIGPAINLFITTPINFILNKFWTFH